MGLDVGTKTIGVSLSDPTGCFAQPAGVITRASFRGDLARLVSLVRGNGVALVVVGLPMNMDGSLGESAARAKRLAEALEDRAGVPVVLWDERLSTVSAERALLEADVSRRRRRQVVDSVAAAIILQSYLDSRKPSDGVEPGCDSHHGTRGAVGEERGRLGQEARQGARGDEGGHEEAGLPQLGDE